MKNILSEKPSTDIHGRLKFSMTFVDNFDIKNKTILDIGSGYGWCELNLLKRGAKSIIASEVTEGDLETIKSNIKDSRVKFQVADAIKLPFGNNSFDTVVCWEVLEHIPPQTENRMFREVYRVLKPNGRFYLSTPFASWPSKLFDPAWWLIKHRHYSLEKLRQFSQQAGLTIKKLFIKGKTWEILYALNMYFSKWVFRRNPLFQNFFNHQLDMEYQSLGLSTAFLKCSKIR